MAPLAGAGLRVLAPDQRGYNLSDKPARIAAYTLDKLAGDVLGLAEAGIALCDRGEVFHRPDGTHWVQHEEPDAVNRLLIDFLA